MGTLDVRQQIGCWRATPVWPLLAQVLFRFVFSYLILFNLFGGNSLLGALWDPLVLWVGQEVFAVEITARPLGSGDTTWNYVQVFCFLVLALAATLVWSLCDRKRRHYEQLHEGLRVFVRFSLALTMITYGAAKAIPVQMPAPSLDRLLEPFGNASPMGLLWTFMGASAGYQIFTGVAELLGGILLTTRRTTLLGALVCIGVMANVAMFNLCYDVPVKLLSSHLLAMSVFLVVPDVGRLITLFVFGRWPQPAPIRPLFTNKVLHRSALVLRTSFVIVLTGFMLLLSAAPSIFAEDDTSRPPLYGIWNVQEFKVDGNNQPLVVTDSFGWRRLVFNYPGVVSIYRLNDGFQYFYLKVDTDKRVLTITKPGDSAWAANLTYQEIEPDLLIVDGTFDGRSIRVKLRRLDESQFLLTSRGFHWVNEYPFNK
jgi:hypothetical protein